MPVLADAQQTDELVDGHVSILKLAGRVGPPELRYRHADCGLRLALKMRGVLLRGEVDNRRPSCCFGDDHGRHMIAGACEGMIGEGVVGPVRLSRCRDGTYVDRMRRA